jgi:hypothetical protein
MPVANPTAPASAPETIMYGVVKQWDQPAVGRVLLIDSTARTVESLRALGWQLHREFPTSTRHLLRHLLVQVYADSVAAYRRPLRTDPPLAPREQVRDKANLVGVYVRDATHRPGQGQWIYGLQGVEHNPTYVVRFSGGMPKRSASIHDGEDESRLGCVCKACSAESRLFHTVELPLVAVGPPYGQLQPSARY